MKIEKKLHSDSFHSPRSSHVSVRFNFLFPLSLYYCTLNKSRVWNLTFWLYYAIWHSSIPRIEVTLALENWFWRVEKRKETSIQSNRIELRRSQKARRKGNKHARSRLLEVPLDKCQKYSPKKMCEKSAKVAVIELLISKIHQPCGYYNVFNR